MLGGPRLFHLSSTSYSALSKTEPSVFVDAATSSFGIFDFACLGHRYNCDPNWTCYVRGRELRGDGFSPIRVVRVVSSQACVLLSVWPAARCSLTAPAIPTTMSRPQVSIERLPTRRLSTESREAMNCKSCRKRKVGFSRVPAPLFSCARPQRRQSHAMGVHTDTGIRAGSSDQVQSYPTKL
jgi:hypothetical protein